MSRSTNNLQMGNVLKSQGADLRVCDKEGPHFWVCLGVAETIVGSLLFYGIRVLFLVVSISCTSHLVVVPVHNTPRNYQTFLNIESVFAR